MLTGQLLLQLIVILIAVQIFGNLCLRIGQQWVIGEILVGLALGPSLLGSLLPNVRALLFPANSLPTLQVLGEIGLVIYMFCLGARLDTHQMLRQSRTAVVVSTSSVLVPLLMGAVLAIPLYPRFAGPGTRLDAFMLLVGTAMAITAFPVLARLLAEKDMLDTKVGTLALTSAAMGDAVAWCLLALVVAIIHAKGMGPAILTIVLAVLYVGFMFVVVRPLLGYAERVIRVKQFLVALCVILLLISAFLTDRIGIHAVFGAFIMGVILPRKAAFGIVGAGVEKGGEGLHRPLDAEPLVVTLRGLDQINNLLFLPLFFAYTGLRTQIGLISAPMLWLICLLILAVACSSKIISGTFAVRWSGQSWREALSLGTLMNTRGLVELIVLNIGLDLGVLSPTLFAMLVIMALVTTMMTSPLLLLLGYRSGGRQMQKEIEKSDIKAG